MRNIESRNILTLEERKSLWWTEIQSQYSKFLWLEVFIAGTLSLLFMRFVAWTSIHYPDLVRNDEVFFWLSEIGEIRFFVLTFLYVIAIKLVLAIAKNGVYPTKEHQDINIALHELGIALKKMENVMTSENNNTLIADEMHQVTAIPAVNDKGQWPPAVKPSSVIVQLSYRDVLRCTTHLGHIDKLFEFAVALGYKYFLWNDSVYQVISEKEFEETGIDATKIL